MSGQRNTWRQLAYRRPSGWTDQLRRTLCITIVWRLGVTPPSAPSGLPHANLSGGRAKCNGCPTKREQQCCDLAFSLASVREPRAVPACHIARSCCRNPFSGAFRPCFVCLSRTSGVLPVRQRNGVACRMWDSLPRDGTAPRPPYAACLADFEHCLQPDQMSGYRRRCSAPYTAAACEPPFLN